MKDRNNSRKNYVFSGSIIILIAGIYCLFLKMAFPNYLYFVLGCIMLIGSVLMTKEDNEQTGGILIVFCSILVLVTFNDLIYATLGDNTLSIGSGPNDYISFSIIERFILILLMLFGAPCALIGGIDGLMGRDGFLEKLNSLKLPHITYIINSILTIFSIGWASFYLYITRTFIDSLVFLPIFLGLLILYFYGWWTLNRMKNLGVVIIMNIIFGIFFAFLSLLNFFYFLVAMLNIFTIGALLTSTKEDRTQNKQTIKQTAIRTSGILIMLTLVFSIMAFPVYYNWENTPIPVTVADNSKDVVEINWAYGSEMSTDWDWLARPEIVNMINTINGNQSEWGINISVTIPLVRELFNETFAPVVANILSTLHSNGIVIDLMPIVDSTVLGDRDEYIHDENIDEFEKVYDEMKIWLANYSLEDTYRSLVIDLERTTSIEINELILNWMNGQTTHIEGQKKLINFMQKLRDNGEIVAGAFFGFHIFDFVDLDDAQQDFFMISIVPPTNWEFIASMIYQNGRGSNMSVYSYCNDMNYHFGDKGVPYAVTMRSSYDDILTRLRIMKNSGFDKIGMWAMHELFANGSNFGMSAHKNELGEADPWTPEQFIQLHEDLSDDGDVTFMFDGYNSENTYETLTLLLDLWLYRRPIYTHGWPIMGDLLPNNFQTKTIITILIYVGIAAISLIMAKFANGEKGDFIESKEQDLKKSEKINSES